MPQIELVGISKQLDDRKGGFSIENLSLTIPDGSTLAVLGPTGCGKTTLLRIVAGLAPADSGRILFDSSDMTCASPRDRRVGMVFQDYALYPHMTSRSNILSYFGFRSRTRELDEIAKAKFRMTSELLEVDMEYLLGRKPSGLSGGEKQRVALGRCITREPSLFLMDEPFSSLDARLRDKYRIHLKKLLSHFGITTVYVTHDQREARLIGDSIAIMNQGRIEQLGRPREIYDDPHNVFVAGFFGSGTDTPAINLVDGALISPQFDHVLIGVRPDEIDVSLERRKRHLHAKVTFVTSDPSRPYRVVEASMPKGKVYVKVPLGQETAVGDDLWLQFRRCHGFDKTTGVRLDLPERLPAGSSSSKRCA